MKNLVRFLKVVRTLYETSTFTQLERPIGLDSCFASEALTSKEGNTEETNSQDCQPEVFHLEALRKHVTLRSRGTALRNKRNHFKRQTVPSQSLDGSSDEPYAAHPTMKIGTTMTCFIPEPRRASFDIN
jgi:hypothetical protein